MAHMRIKAMEIKMRVITDDDSGTVMHSVPEDAETHGFREWLGCVIMFGRRWEHKRL